jgi:GDP-L-fucose synthase
MTLRLLITGGTGFLGKHVMNIMNKSEAYYTWAPSSKEIDVSNPACIDHLIEWKPDVILHMAAICGGILANKNSPADFLHKNLDMASNIFHAAKAIDGIRVYTLGSVCSYPKYCPAPFQEDNIWNGYPEETNAPYGVAKRVQLMFSQTYRQQYGIKGAHLIPVNLYGEYDHFDLVNSHVIPALIRKFDNAVTKNLPQVECWGTGDATREFLYAGDAAEALCKAVHDHLDTDLPINLGTGKNISIKNLAFLIGDLVGYKGEVVFTGDVSDGQPNRVLNVSRAQEVLGWAAKTDFKTGLLKTINWYKTNKQSVIGAGAS